MKNSVRRFIYNYVESFASNNNYPLKIEEIIDIKDGAMLELSNTLKILKKEDPDVYENILALDKDGLLLDYLQIIYNFDKKRRNLLLSMAKISRQSGICISTLKRIEGLHSIPTVRVLMNILKTVNLKLINT